MPLRRRDFLFAAGIAPVALTLGARRPAFAIDTPLVPNTNLDLPPSSTAGANANLDTPPAPNTNLDTPPTPKTNLDTPSQTSVFGSPITTNSSNTKMSTSTVAFQNQPNAGARCANCRFYNASNSSCAQVIGDFHANGWCLMHTP
ncbi:MAG: hypothetical protein AAGJ70_01070 [Pseudomonadota bacterium]